MVKWWFARVHEVECSILIALFLFLSDRNYISIKFNDGYSTDSMQDCIGIGQGRSPDSPHGQVHVEWTASGLEVD